jgi:sensor histidine kinase YesM
MNPHFIFNSLSSINWFIMENDKDTASDYLTRFSRLMRLVLNAQQPMIPLEDELKMLQLYLDLERLRFDNSFDYSISFTNAMDAGTISIPPMLLQPFCENAIWHGFMNKKEQGHININIRTEDNLLECTITDNGIGRNHASAMKMHPVKKEKSFGLDITRERLSLFGEENNAAADFKIEDLSDANGNSTGTKVILTIEYKNAITKAA